MAEREVDPDSPVGRGGVAPVTAAAAPGSGRSGLDRRRILGAAVEFIDERGLRALTMRRLGDRLGVEAMALYRYVPGREDLLDGIVETVIDELYGDPDVYLEPRDGWHDYLQRLAHGVRRVPATCSLGPRPYRCPQLRSVDAETPRRRATTPTPRPGASAGSVRSPAPACPLRRATGP